MRRNGFYASQRLSASYQLYVILRVHKCYHFGFSWPVEERYIPHAWHMKISWESEQLYKHEDSKSSRATMLVYLKKLIEANHLFRTDFTFQASKTLVCEP